jgi:hypothetical protein
MISLDHKLFSRVVLTSILVLMLALPAIKAVNAQTTTNYFVTVNPTTPDSQMYTTVGRNWTVSFEALWSYGDDSGTAIVNATVTVQVYNSKTEVVDTLSLNTTNGLFSFNYSSSTAEILTFTPTKLVASDGIEYDSNLLDAENSLYGFQSKSVVVWWDTFHVSLVSYDTDAAGVTTVSVNVTYLLLPEEGLTLPEWATYSHQTFLPKTAHNVNVTINSVKAEETSTKGLFKANVSTWLPTAYIHVGVTQEGWVTTHTGFSFAHNANESSWQYAVISGLALTVAVLMIFFVLRRKEGSNVLSLKNYPILGGVLLAITSVISLYWGLVGLDSTLHGFDWLLLTIFGLLSFGFGLASALLSLRKKIQPLVIFVINMPMITNLVGVKYSLDMYGLTIPWLMLIASFVLSFVSAVLICNADEVFT